MAAIVFDLDGTLVDSAPDIRRAGNVMLASVGAGPLDLTTVRGLIGRGAPVFVEGAMSAAGLPPDPELRARLLARFMEVYETAVDLSRLYAGVREALDTLTDAGHRFGLCTNKPLGPTRAVLAHFDLAQRFDAVIGGDSLPVAKPDSAPLRAALEEMGATRCLYVGDSEVDAATARAAAMPFALFTEGYRKAAVDTLPHDLAFDDWSRFPERAASLLG